MGIEYIKKQDAIDACYDGFADNRDDCAANIKELPAEDVKPVIHAHWVHKVDTNGIERWVCSHCGEEPWWCAVAEDILPPFCPMCGADTM